MRLAALIKDSRSAVVDRWYEHVLAAYPPETVKLWRKHRDQFLSPVGHIFHDALGRLTDALTAWKDASEVAAPLEEIIKIRAVQDMSPGKALTFVFGFKKLLRELFAEPIRQEGLGQDVAVFDTRVDNLALIAFDIYTKNREALFEMRVQEFKSAHHMAFRKAGIMCESPRQALGLDEENPNGQAR